MSHRKNAHRVITPSVGPGPPGIRQITVDLRVFWPHDVDPEAVVQQLRVAYLEVAREIVYGPVPASPGAEPQMLAPDPAWPQEPATVEVLPELCPARSPHTDLECLRDAGHAGPHQHDWVRWGGAATGPERTADHA